MYMHVLLRDGRYPSSNTICKRPYGISKRTFYRDIHDLRYEFRAPLAYDSSRRGYYYTIPGWNIFD